MAKILGKLHGKNCMTKIAWQKLHDKNCMAKIAWQKLHGKFAW